MAYCEEGIFKGYRSRSPPIDIVSIRAILPLNTHRRMQHQKNGFMIQLRFEVH